MRRTCYTLGLVLGLSASDASWAGTFNRQYLHEALLDVDNNVATGGSVTLIQGAELPHAEPGFEYRAIAYVDRCNGRVGDVELWQWNGADFVEVFSDGATYDLGSGQGLGGSTMVEWEVPAASIPQGLGQTRLIFHASQLAQNNDYTAAVFLGASSIEVPALAPAGVALLGLGLAAVALAVIRRRGRGAWAPLSVVLFVAGLATASAGGGFIMDGLSADWAGIDPRVNDPAGDSSIGDANEDILHGFTVPGGVTHTFRMDLGTQAQPCG